MKAIALLSLILIVLDKVDRQTKTNYHQNPFDRIFTNCDNSPRFGKDSLDLQKYLGEKLKHQIKTTTGQIQVSLLIDTTGKVLCESITNNSTLNINKFKLNELFDEMPNWNCGLQNGYKVNCSEQVVLTLNKQSL